jgi:hypothetical protein
MFAWIVKDICVKWHYIGVKSEGPEWVVPLRRLIFGDAVDP